MTVQDPVTGEVGTFPVRINWPKQLTAVHVPAKQPNCFRAQTFLDPRRSISTNDLRHVLQSVTRSTSRPERPAPLLCTGPTFIDSPPINDITRRFEELGDELNYTPHFDLSVPYDYRSPASPPKLIVPKPTSPPAAPIDLFASKKLEAKFGKLFEPAADPVALLASLPSGPQFSPREKSDDEISIYA